MKCESVIQAKVLEIDWCKSNSSAKFFNLLFLCYFSVSEVSQNLCGALQLVLDEPFVSVLGILNSAWNSLFTFYFSGYHTFFSGLRQRWKTLAFRCQLMFCFCVYSSLGLRGLSSQVFGCKSKSVVHFPVSRMSKKVCLIIVHIIAAWSESNIFVPGQWKGDSKGVFSRSSFRVYVSCICCRYTVFRKIDFFL